MSALPNPTVVIVNNTNNSANDGSTNTQNNDPSNNVPPAQVVKDYPPGIGAITKCQDDNSDKNVQLTELVVDLLFKVNEGKLLDIPKNSRGTGERWRALYENLFTPETGLFCGYKKWTVASPWTSKLKKLVIDIVVYFSHEYDNIKGAREPTALEELSHTLKQTMENAEKDKAVEQDSVLARRLQNELCEKDMGFTSSGNGVASPSGILLGPSERDGLAALGRPTQSVGNVGQSRGAIFNAAAAAASMATQPFDASRSRSAFEAELANSAAKRSKPEHGVSLKKARNMDNHALTDSLSNALCSTTKQFTSAIERLAPSPSTKSSKARKNIQEEILLVIKEIKDLQEINGNHDYDNELKAARARLVALQKKRDE